MSYKGEKWVFGGLTSTSQKQGIGKIEHFSNVKKMM
jgi:hypothetical protein